MSQLHSGQASHPVSQMGLTFHSQTQFGLGRRIAQSVYPSVSKPVDKPVRQSDGCHIALTYEGCSFSDVLRSIKQEVAVRFTYNIHIPSKYSLSLRTHSSNRLRQDSKAF